MLSLEFFGDPVDFLRVAGAYLAADPVVGTVVAGVTRRMVEEAREGVSFPAPYRPWWLTVRGEGGQVVGVGMRTSPVAPYPMFLLPMPDAAAVALAEALHARGERLGGLNGARPAVDRAAEAWAALTGGRVRPVQHTRLFELADLVVPSAPPGRLRPARPDDLALALDWFGRFHAETDEQSERGPGERSLETATESEEEMRRRIAQGRVWLWETPSGERVHLTGANPPAYGVARIGPVFTPRPQRGRGYAGAAVAAVARGFVDQGARVALFTDQANPTSNDLYRRLGFRAVVDMALLLEESARDPRGEAVS